MSNAEDTRRRRHLAAACILEGLEEAGLSRVPHRVIEAAVSPLTPATKVSQEASNSPIGARIEACRACPLGASRNRTVPGEGATNARIMFIGEAPGAKEDRSGRPFVGPSGELLEKIIQFGMGLRREEVFIANTLKCRPPEDRDPLPAEISACSPFLEEQIAAVQPDLLIALGRHAARHLLQIDASLDALRGKLHHRPQTGPPVLVTYHPTYLLHNPEAKRACWTDIQLGMAHLGLPVPGA